MLLRLCLLLEFLFIVRSWQHNPCRESGPKYEPGNPREYFWRDYYGKVPDDAFPGINTPEGRTYIGQGYVAPFGLLPSAIYPGCRTALAASFANEIKVNIMGIKILCTDDPSLYTWIDPISIEVRNCKLVEGGTEDGQTLYIGRGFSQHTRQEVLGKVLVDAHIDSGMWAPVDNTTEWIPVYQVLAYDCR